MDVKTNLVLSCNKKGHEEHQASLICFEDSCRETGLLCANCRNEFHTSHRLRDISAFIFDLSTLIDSLPERVSVSGKEWLFPLENNYKRIRGELHRLRELLNDKLTALIVNMDDELGIIKAKVNSSEILLKESGPSIRKTMNMLINGISKLTNEEISEKVKQVKQHLELNPHFQNSSISLSGRYRQALDLFAKLKKFESSQVEFIETMGAVVSDIEQATANLIIPVCFLKQNHHIEKYKSSPLFHHSLQRVLKVQQNYEINNIDWLSDGNLVASVLDNTLHIIDASNGKKINSIKAHNSWIRALAIKKRNELISTSEYGGYDLVATGSDDFSIKLWGYEKGTLRFIKELGKNQERSSYHWAICFIDNGPMTSARGSKDGFVIRLYDVNLEKSVGGLEGHTQKVYALAYIKESRKLVSAGDDDTIRVWDLQHLLENRILPAYQDGILSMIYHRKLKFLVTGGKNGSVVTWSLGLMKEELFRKDKAHNSSIISIAKIKMRDKQQLFATGSLDGAIKIWNWKGSSAISLIQPHQGKIASLAFRTSKGLLCAGDNHGKLFIWGCELT